MPHLITEPNNFDKIAPKNLTELIQQLDLWQAYHRSLTKKRQTISQAIQIRENRLTKPAGSLGRLEELTHWWHCGRLQYDPAQPATINNPLLLVFAGNHGVANKGVSAFPPAVTAEMVKNFEQGGAAINQLTKTFGIKLKVYSLNNLIPTQDFTEQPAMTEQEFFSALKIGYDAVTAGTELLLLGEMGIGNTTSAAALSTALVGYSDTLLANAKLPETIKADNWVGYGTGLDDQGRLHKIAMVELAVQNCFRKFLTADHFTTNNLSEKKKYFLYHTLRYLGGYELIAITGAVLRAVQLAIPILLDGYASSIAGLALGLAWQEIWDYQKIGHLSAEGGSEKGHALLVKTLKQNPLINCQMRLGEGTGAALGFALLQAGLNCHQGMASFSEAGVSEKILP